MSIQGAFDILLSGKKNKAAILLNPVIIRIAKQVSWSIRRPEIADDLAQEFWLKIEDVAKSYDGSTPEEGYIHGWMRNIGKEMSRRNPHPVSVDEPFEDLSESISVQHRIESDIDRKIARDAIMKNISEKTMSQQSIRLPFCQPTGTPGNASGTADSQRDPLSEMLSNIRGPLAPKEKPAPKEKALTPSHARIREVRLLLDLTQIEYAEALGLRTPTLVSYEQGQTKKVPESVMERVEELYANEGEGISRHREHFANRSMCEILDSWAEQLDADPTDLATMAAFIGTVPSTISRWRSNECRPSLRELVAYDAVVRKMALRVRKASHNVDTKIVREPVGG